MGIRAWWRRKFGKDISTFTDEEKVTAYVMAGCEMGGAVSYIYMGEQVGFDKLLDQWETAEKAYAGLGFRTLSVDDFMRTAWGHSIDGLLRIPRRQGEKPVYHAVYYREHFFGKIGMLDIVKLAIASGNYMVPSTEHLKEH